MKQRDIRSRPSEAASAVSVMENTTSTGFHAFKMNAIDGSVIDFAKYKGKKVLILNVASKCGYTPQYADWEKFYKEHNGNVEVLGFPANDFLSQEPGSNGEISEFCQKNYGVSFQLFEKITVKGEGKAPLYQWLTDKSKNGWNEKEPAWNFCKYLINEKGELTNYFSSGVKPDDAEFTAALGK